MDPVYSGRKTRNTTGRIPGQSSHTLSSSTTHKKSSKKSTNVEDSKSSSFPHKKKDEMLLCERSTKPKNLVVTSSPPSDNKLLLLPRGSAVPRNVLNPSSGQQRSKSLTPKTPFVSLGPKTAQSKTIQSQNDSETRKSLGKEAVKYWLRENVLEKSLSIACDPALKSDHHLLSHGMVTEQSMNPTTRTLGRKSNTSMHHTLRSSNQTTATATRPKKFDKNNATKKIFDVTSSPVLDSEPLDSKTTAKKTKTFILSKSKTVLSEEASVIKVDPDQLILPYGGTIQPAISKPTPANSRKGEKGTTCALTRAPQQEMKKTSSNTGRKVQGGNRCDPCPLRPVDPIPKKSDMTAKGTTTRPPVSQHPSQSKTRESIQTATTRSRVPLQLMDSSLSKPGRKAKGTTNCPPISQHSLDPTQSKTEQSAQVAVTRSRVPLRPMDPTKSAIKAKETKTLNPVSLHSVDPTQSKTGPKVQGATRWGSVPQQPINPTLSKSGRKAKGTTTRAPVSHPVDPSQSKAKQKVQSPVTRSRVLLQPMDSALPKPGRKGKVATTRTAVPQHPVDSSYGKTSPKSNILEEKKTLLKRQSKTASKLSNDEKDRDKQIARNTTFVGIEDTKQLLLSQGETSAGITTNPTRVMSLRKTQTFTISSRGQTTTPSTKTSKKCKDFKDFESTSMSSGKAVKNYKVGKDQLAINSPVVSDTTVSLIRKPDQPLFPQGEQRSPVASTSTYSLRKSKTPTSITRSKKASTKNLQSQDNFKYGKVVPNRKADKDPLAVVVSSDSKQLEREETISNNELDGIPLQTHAHVPQILDSKDTASVIRRKPNDTNKEVKEVNRKTRIKTSNIPRLQLAELVKQDETKPHELSVKRKPTGITPSASSQIPKWDTAVAQKLLMLLKENGFDGNFKELMQHFPGHSDNSLRYLFSTLRMENKKKEAKCKVATVSRKLIKLIRDDQESQSLGINIPLFLEFYAMFGHHPDPSQVGEVDYPAILRCVASLARGYIPKELNSSSAAKLVSLVDLMLENVKLRNGLHPIPEGMQMPTKKDPISRQERNVILARRRSTSWSEEEIIARKDVLSLDLAVVRKRYLSLACFNPFKFPPE